MSDLEIILPRLKRIERLSGSLRKDIANKQAAPSFCRVMLAEIRSILTTVEVDVIELTTKEDPGNAELLDAEIATLLIEVDRQSEVDDGGIEHCVDRDDRDLPEDDGDGLPEDFRVKPR